MEKHIASIHEGKKPFKCDDCNDSFARKYDLKTHIKIVHERKWFRCYRCVQTFSSQQNMEKHIKRLHDGNSLDIKSNVSL